MFFRKRLQLFIIILLLGSHINASSVVTSMAYVDKAKNDVKTHGVTELGKTSALKNLNKAIAIDPKNEHAYFYRAAVFFLFDEPNKAIKDVDKMIELNPKNADAYELKGAIAEKKEDYLLALKYYKKAIKLNPQNRVNWMNKSRVLMTLKNYKEALKAVDVALSVPPKDKSSLTTKSAWLIQVRANLKYKMKDLKGAAEDYIKSSELWAKDASSKTLDNFQLNFCESASSESRQKAIDIQKEMSKTNPELVDSGRKSDTRVNTNKVNETKATPVDNKNNLKNGYRVNVENYIFLFGLEKILISARFPYDSVSNVLAKVKAEKTANMEKYLALLNKYTNKWRDSNYYYSTSIDNVVKHTTTNKDGTINIDDTADFAMAGAGAGMFLGQDMIWCNFLKDLNNLNNSNVRIYANTMNMVNMISK